MLESTKIKKISQEIKNEYIAARKKFPKFNSIPEAFAIIQEELDEWFDSIKQNKPDRKEVLQVAAMIYAFNKDLMGRTFNNNVSKLPIYKSHHEAYGMVDIAYNWFKTATLDYYIKNKDYKKTPKNIEMILMLEALFTALVAILVKWEEIGVK